MGSSPAPVVLAQAGYLTSLMLHPFIGEIRLIMCQSQYLTQKTKSTLRIGDLKEPGLDVDL